MSPQDRLQAWLAAATLGLRPEVAAAIREEVAAHVEDAMAERGLAGLGSEAALAKAVADLGDPAQSRRAALAAARRPQAGGR
ncbi:hypothetical protein IIA16_06870, partial [bacterium]|nr:hypothetical protein [bacterium]